MYLIEGEKTDFAIALKAKVNEAYAYEILGSKGVLSYLGVCKITDTVEQEFAAKGVEFPVIIKGACHLARALRNSDKVKTQEDLRKGFALLVTTADGLSIAWGILSMLNLWTAFWVFVFGIHIPVLGPFAVAGGLATAVAGVYVALARQTPEQLSVKAYDLLTESILNWADEKAAKERDAAAKKALLLNYSRNEQGSIIWRTVTWPYRTAYDFINEDPKKLMSLPKSTKRASTAVNSPNFQP
jgi:hypothetical protein